MATRTTDYKQEPEEVEKEKPVAEQKPAIKKKRGRPKKEENRNLIEITWRQWLYRGNEARQFSVGELVDPSDGWKDSP